MSAGSKKIAYGCQMLTLKHQKDIRRILHVSDGNCQMDVRLQLPNECQRATVKWTSDDSCQTNVKLMSMWMSEERQR